MLLIDFYICWSDASQNGKIFEYFKAYKGHMEYVNI